MSRPDGRRTINRRQAIGALGVVSLSSLLAACGDGSDSAGQVTTTDGSTATVETKSPTPAGTASRLSPADFDSASTCQVTTEQIEGPYYFDVDAIRSDLREDREGTLLRLGVRVRDAASCEPIENAVVDIWHCDATGLYSGFESASQGGPGGGSGPADDETYLRGAQATNADGIAEFKTIYPGWYRGRTTHIHAKVHLDRTTVLTTQFYTSKEVDDQVYVRAPYNEDPGRDTFNDTDFLYVPDGQLTLTKDGDVVTGVITVDVERS